MSATTEAMNLYRITTPPLDDNLHYLLRTYQGVIGMQSAEVVSVDIKVLQPDNKKEVKALRRLGWERVYFMGALTTYNQNDAENFAYASTPEDPIYDEARLKDVCGWVDETAKDLVGISTGLVVSQPRLDIRAKERFADAKLLRLPQPDSVYAAVTSFRERTALISDAYDEMPEILASGDAEGRSLFRSRETQGEVIDPTLVHEEEWRLMEALHDAVRAEFANSFRPQ
jgi:hypothetical protein